MDVDAHMHMDQPLTRQQLSDWLVAHLAAARGLSTRSIDPRERFGRYGLDSLGAARMIAALALCSPRSPLLSKILGSTLIPIAGWQVMFIIEGLLASLGGIEPVEVAGVGEAEQDAGSAGV